MTPTRLLVVDDEPGILEMFASVFGKLGCTVVTAPGGVEALRLAVDEPFDIAFCDTSMPVMSGLAVMRALHKLQIDLPVVIMTGYPSDESELDAKLLGAFAYIAKPSEISVLETLIDRALAQSKAPRERTA